MLMGMGGPPRGDTRSSGYDAVGTVADSSASALEGGEDALAEGLDEGARIRADGVQVDGAEAQLDVPPQPLDVPVEVGRDAQLAPQVLRAHAGGLRVELLGRGQLLQLRQVHR